MYHDECGTAGIDTSQLGHDQSGPHDAVARTSIALYCTAGDVQRGDLRHKLKRKFSPLPIGDNDWRNLLLLFGPNSLLSAAEGMETGGRGVGIT